MGDAAGRAGRRPAIDAVDRDGWPTPPRSTYPVVEQRVEVDVAVVGGGLAGLATACALVERNPGRSVAVVEADRIGSGASGASSGMVGPGMGGWLTQNRRRYGDTVAAAQVRSTREAVRELRDLVTRTAIDCELRAEPQYRVACTTSEARRLAAEADAYRDLGLDVALLAGAEVDQCRLPPSVVSALVFDDAALINPLALCVGLAGWLSERGVEVYESSRVLSAGAERAGRSLRCATGAVRCGQVVLATDASTAQLDVAPGRVVPLHSHIVKTPPLDPGYRPGLGWDGVGAIVGSRNFFNYFRMTASGELVFGGGAPIYRRHPSDRHAGSAVGYSDREARAVVTELVEWFPVLSELTQVSAWSGPMGFTLDRLPMIGRIDGRDGVALNGAWCGHGLALSVWGANRLAEVLDTPGAAADPVLGTCAPSRRLTRLPGDPWRAIGLRGYLASLRWRDRWARHRSTSRRRAGPDAGAATTASHARTEAGR